MLSLLELPPRLRDRIKVDPGSGCWIWTGGFTRARTQVISPNRAPESSRTRVNPKETWLREAKAVGRCWEPTLGYNVDAHKAVFAAAHGLSLQATPRLKRCHCAECVNPNHAVPLPSHRPRRSTERRPQGQIETAFKHWKDVDILAALKTTRPYPGMGPAACADEAGCPEPSDAVFQQYRIWDAENPD